ncbi:MAG: hypothetical protein L6Q29_01180 [Candidatus Pacebacteria bacterium]|nr:hypothetical protein [Candidatus Paceibacterota bacterium]NUQ57107.1 hypothetical protein [Candidatus Paceibacter sp.]
MKKFLIIIFVLILAGAGFYFLKDKIGGGNIGGKEAFCTPEQRNVDACAKIYKPVCATVNIQCIKAPCEPIKQTFGNSCEACRNSLVNSYIEGECEGN